jgi:hypothetical protein
MKILRPLKLIIASVINFIDTAMTTKDIMKKVIGVTAINFFFYIII